ncbi:MAG: DUF433 domain-containing protein [Rubrobacteraceae bacterium]
MIETRYEHVVLDEDHVSSIAGTTMKVVELVAEQRAYGWSPEELQFQHPYLELGQIYSALAYYWDHREDLDRDIQRRLEQVDSLSEETRNSSLAEKFRARGGR